MDEGVDTGPFVPDSQFLVIINRQTSGESAGESEYAELWRVSNNGVNGFK